MIYNETMSGGGKIFSSSIAGGVNYIETGAGGVYGNAGVTPEYISERNLEAYGGASAGGSSPLQMTFNSEGLGGLAVESTTKAMVGVDYFVRMSWRTSSMNIRWTNVDVDWRVIGHGGAVISPITTKAWFSFLFFRFRDYFIAPPTAAETSYIKSARIISSGRPR
jgi:hypothetical protein